MNKWHASEPQRLKPRGRTCLPLQGSYRAIDEQLNRSGRWRT